MEIRKTIIFNEHEIIDALEAYYNNMGHRNTKNKKISFYRNVINIFPDDNKIEIEIDEAK